MYIQNNCLPGLDASKDVVHRFYAGSVCKPGSCQPPSSLQTQPGINVAFPADITTIDYNIAGAEGLTISLSPLAQPQLEEYLNVFSCGSGNGYKPPNSANYKIGGDCTQEWMDYWKGKATRQGDKWRDQYDKYAQNNLLTAKCGAVKVTANYSITYEFGFVNDSKDGVSCGADKVVSDSISDVVTKTVGPWETQVNVNANAAGSTYPATGWYCRKCSSLFGANRAVVANLCAKLRHCGGRSVDGNNKTCKCAALWAVKYAFVPVPKSDPYAKKLCTATGSKICQHPLVPVNAYALDFTSDSVSNAACSGSAIGGLAKSVFSDVHAAQVSLLSTVEDLQSDAEAKAMAKLNTIKSKCGIAYGKVVNISVTFGVEKL